MIGYVFLGQDGWYHKNITWLRELSEVVIIDSRDDKTSRMINIIPTLPPQRGLKLIGDKMIEQSLDYMVLNDLNHKRPSIYFNGSNCQLSDADTIRFDSNHEFKELQYCRLSQWAKDKYKKLNDVEKYHLPKMAQGIYTEKLYEMYPNAHSLIVGAKDDEREITFAFALDNKIFFLYDVGEVWHLKDSYVATNFNILRGDLLFGYIIKRIISSQTKRV